MTNDLLTCLAVDICPVLFVEWTPERGGMGKAEEKRESGVWEGGGEKRGGCGEGGEEERGGGSEQ